MAALSTKFSLFLFLTIFGGGWTAPLGLPPAPEEPSLARIAPEKCLFYVSWAGMAEADAKSKNRTEQLLAEPEVQRLLAALETLASNMVAPVFVGNRIELTWVVPHDPSQPETGKDKDRDVLSFRRSAMEFARIIATNPGAVFASKVDFDKGGNLQNCRGGMMCAAGKDAEKLRADFDEIRKLVFPAGAAPAAGVPVIREVQIAGGTWYRITFPADAVSITCGFQGSDFIAVAGDGSLEEILKRRSQEPPAWLVALRKDLPVERVSMVAYLNIKMLMDQVTAGGAMPKTREALHALGLDNLSALSSVSGLEGETFVSKMLLSTEGAPQGLLTLFSDRPLRAADLTAIPRDATLGFAMRFDAQKVVDEFAAMAKKLEPARRTAIEGHWDALTKSLDVDLRRELPKALGDTCCIYTSPGEGGLVVLGLTAVLPIKDRNAFSVMQAKILASTAAKGLREKFTLGSGTPPSRSTTPQLQSFEFAGQRVFYFTGVGIAPARCATQSELIVGMTPQNVMAYLQHDAAHTSLAAVPQVARLIESADAPSMIEYVDTAKLFELVYPLVPLAVSSGMISPAEPQPLPLHAIPSAPAIRRHLVPGTAALSRTKRGLELVSRQPLPGTGMLWSAAVITENPLSLESEVSVEGKPSINSFDLPDRQTPR